MTNLPMQNIFAKGIDQQINGVIKANDEKDLVNEVNDYVLTAELQQNLQNFLEMYNDPVNRQNNGVWISGFYGSGKSHLLKMISHIIGDIPHNVLRHDDASPIMDRAEVVQAFKTKAKEQDDLLLEGEIERTMAIPATSILFNIGQRTNQTSSEAVLDAFVRVFNEARGYAGAAPAIALFERDLDNHGWLDAFREAFEQEAHELWQDARSAYQLWDDEIRTAYSKVTGKPVENDIVGQYFEQYRHYTVEDFVNDVASWLDKQEPTHRVIFLADEIGQFIGEHTERMLELQSIVEGLSVRCLGRAWVIVTSQEDMDAMVGDRTKQQSYDFSKIEARFKCKLKLNSADVIEIIQKRLLTKTPQGDRAMARLWDEQHENFRTLFDFDGTGASYNYANHHEDEDSFEASYPFVGYQFSLFQNALRKLSEYNMFSGSYQSVGERSMISAINATLHTCKGETVGELMPFDRLYEGISDAIQSTSTYRIRDAKQQLAPQYRDLGVRILKVLLLIKHVDGMKATVRNLRVLLTSRFNEDVLDLEERIKDTLQELEHGTFIERIGDGYSYLTNEEKDIEQEIKNIEVDHVDVLKTFQDIVTNDIFKSSGKVVFGPQRQSFKFGLKIDNTPQSAGKPELWLNLITSIDEGDRQQAIRLNYGHDDELVALLATDDPTLFDDFRMYQKTQLYTMRTDTNAQSEIRRSIITGKINTNRQLYEELKKRVAFALEKADLYHNGIEITTNGSDPRARMENALQTVLGKIYPNHMLIGDRPYSASQVAKTIIDTSPDGKRLDDMNAASHNLDIPSEEIISWIMRYHDAKISPSVQNIVEKYSDPPYGWPVDATLTFLAHLYALGRITLEFDGKPVARTEAAKSLTDKRKQDALLVSIPKVYDARKVQELRSFAREYLPSTSQAGNKVNATDLATQIRKELIQHLHDVQNLLNTNRTKYPFVTQLEEPINRLKQVVGHSSTWLIEQFTDTHVRPNMNDLQDDNEDIIMPIMQFINGQQGRLYVDSMQWLRNNQENINASSPQMHQLRDEAMALADDERIYRGNRVKQLNNVVTQLQTQIDASLEHEREGALTTVQEVRTQVMESDAYHAAAETARKQADRKMDDVQHTIERQSTILGIRDLAIRLQDEIYPNIINALNAAAEQVSAPVAPSADNPQPVQVKTTPAPKAVSLRTLPIPSNTRSLKTKDDVDDFLDAYRRILINAIENGEQILL